MSNLVLKEKIAALLSKQLTEGFGQAVGRTVKATFTGLILFTDGAFIRHSCEGSCGCTITTTDPANVYDLRAMGLITEEELAGCTSAIRRARAAESRRAKLIQLKTLRAELGVGKAVGDPDFNDKD